MKKNRYIRRCFLLFIILSVCTWNSFAQVKKVPATGKLGAQPLQRLGIGDQVPLSIWKEIPKKKSTELIILDFWSTGCASCIEAFPKMDRLQKQFSEKLQIVLLNPWENAQRIKEYFTAMNTGRIKNGLEQMLFPELPAINGDARYKLLFPAFTIPHHVWLSGTGKVVAITSGYNATPEHIKAFLDGEKLNMMVKDDFPGKELVEKGYLQPTLANMPAVYYSAFIPYFMAAASVNKSTDTLKGTYRITHYNDGVIEHFKNAFRDNRPGARQRVLIELKEKQKYVHPSDNANLIDDYLRERTFTYEIQVPLKDKDNWQDKMKQDVNAFFGSKFAVKGGMEKRRFNCLVLVKTKDGLLKSAGGKANSDSKVGFERWTNQPFRYVVSSLYRLEDMDAMRPFVDESGVDQKLRVDIQLTGDLRDVQSLRKQLQQYGLDIIDGERELEVLVIKDK